MLVPAHALLQAAYGRFIIGAYNVQNMEQVLGVFRGSLAARAPVIVAAVPFARDYAGAAMLTAMVRTADEMYPEAVVAMHLDHGDEAHCHDAIVSGSYSSVMIDASHKPFEENIAITRRVVDHAHAAGVTVEAELGVVAGLEGRSSSDGAAALTDPAQAAEFVERTGCDSLAVAIGTSHGAYKTLRYDKDGNALPPALALDRIEKIEKNLEAAGFKNYPLVMHGSSSVPQELVDQINKYGGKMKATMGIPMTDIQFGIKRGVRKINVDTDGRLAITAAIRKVLYENPEKFDPRDYLKPAREALYKVILGKVKDFGQAGHAKDYAPMSLEDMKKIYAKGSSSCGCCCGKS